MFLFFTIINLVFLTLFLILRSLDQLPSPPPFFTSPSPPKTNIIKDCSTTDDILAIEYITLNPDPPIRGHVLNIKAAGNLNETIDQGSYVDVLVRLGLVQLYKGKLDFCKEIEQNFKLKCPLKKGMHKVDSDVNVPKEIPMGKYTVDAQAYTKNGRRIACLKAETVFKP
ncbi:5150_t:CDS:2 [Ambispora gerdemannii]|uniref:Phosphatidylglycerol/phosphatidylinositol transfer protein n=1 Tax=Ambispora gerdemannii TaxID=144530 RepID=A0A9N9DDF2_9GLOM|nr:5150_t:CDS:2 [Ambispora gerdemannii]